jgi:hypothetical protein
MVYIRMYKIELIFSPAEYTRETDISSNVGFLELTRHSKPLIGLENRGCIEKNRGEITLCGEEN